MSSAKLYAAAAGSKLLKGVEFVCTVGNTVGWGAAQYSSEVRACLSSQARPEVMCKNRSFIHSRSFHQCQ